MSKIALLFPGQGSQIPNMGRRLAESSSDAMELWKKAERACNIPLREIYWDTDEEAMANTRALQPALTVANLALWQFLAKRFDVGCAAGHSLGEYAALAAAKVLSFEKVFELTSLRGRLMDAADPSGVGAMAAILKLDCETVKKLVEQSVEETREILRIANYNTPGQFVVSGNARSVEHLLLSVKSLKGRGLPLKVSGAFHTPLMGEAAAEFSHILHQADWRNPDFPIYCNVSGKAVKDAFSLREIMTLQMTSSVLWIDIMQNQWADGVRKFLEIGPKAVLSKMVNACISPVSSEGEEFRVASITDYDQEKPEGF